MATKLIDMKRTAAERKAREKENKVMGSPGGTEYPYGLGISLGHDELTKLGIKELPRVGSKMHIQAHAHVKSASESSHEGGRKDRRVELELRHMVAQAVKKASEQEIHEGNLTGAKAALDKALDEQEAGNSKGGRKGKVTKKDLGSEDPGNAENG